MSRARFLGASLALAVFGTASVLHAKSLQSRFTTPLTRPIGQALADSIGRAIPIPAASPGVTFRFDPATHAFERETELVGPIFLERAQTLGRNKLNFSLAYEWVPIDTFDGRDLSDLRDTGDPIFDPQIGRLVRQTRYALDVDTHVALASFTWGVTDDLDLNLTVPILSTRLSVGAGLTVYQSIDLDVLRRQQDHVHEWKTGVGDVELRAKQRVARGTWGELALGLVLRTPSGEQDNFQGLGEWQLSPQIYASSPAWRPTPWLRLQSHANLSLDLTVEDTTRSEFRAGIGVEAGFWERFTLSVSFLAREPFAGIEHPGFFDVTRVDPQTGRRYRNAFLGLNSRRWSYYDLAVGGRVVLWRDTVFGFANVLVPLNDDGFRSDVIPMVGLEVAF